MCRFAMYLGPPTTLSTLVTAPRNSIIRQSFQSRELEEPLNGDGFGVAWYVPEISSEPAVFKDLTPAWSNANLHSLAAVTRSGCILAHVRAATVGMAVTRLNCHPFTHGSFAFMHNGRIAGFRKIVRRLHARLSDEAYGTIQGSTDSETLFALFTDRYRESIEEDPVDRMAGALEAAIAEVETLRREAGVQDVSLLNLALTDGYRAVATRFVSPNGGREPHSLYTLTGGCLECQNDVVRMVDEGVDTAAMIVSEPLTEQDGWQRVAANHLVTIDEDRSVSMRPIVLE